MSTETVVSAKALPAGSQDPPRKSGVFRLYTSRFCSYALRIRLLMEIKKIPYETVNCHLLNKPEWLSAKENNEAGNVPVLQRDDQILTESLVICDYLDELYPEPKLQSSDPFVKAKHRLLIGKVDKMFGIVRQIIRYHKIEEIANLVKDLTYFERLLENLNQPYFAGGHPGMVDYMVWPHFQVTFTVKDLFQFPEFPKLTEYFERMADDPMVKSTALPFPLVVSYYKTVVDEQIDFDIGLN